MAPPDGVLPEEEAMLSQPCRHNSLTGDIIDDICYSSLCVWEKERQTDGQTERERKRCIHLILNKLFELCFVPVIALMNDWFVQAVYTSSLNNKFI